jgi:uncharacterized protein YjbJ (UPF0337 family)
MNEDRIQGDWKQVTGKVKEQWGILDRLQQEVGRTSWL